MKPSVFLVVAAILGIFGFVLYKLAGDYTVILEHKSLLLLLVAVVLFALCALVKPDLVVRGIDRVNNVIGWITGILVVTTVLIIFGVVVVNLVTGFYSKAWEEGYILVHASVFMLGAGYTLMHEGHVRIDLIYASKGQQYKDIVNIGGSLLFALPVLASIFYFNWKPMTRDLGNIDFTKGFYDNILLLDRSPETGLPGYFTYLKVLIALFCILFALQFIALALRSALSLNGIQVRSLASNNSSAHSQ